LYGVGFKWDESEDGTLVGLMNSVRALLVDMKATAPPAPGPAPPPPVDHDLAAYDVLPMAPDSWPPRDGDGDAGDGGGATDLGEGWYVGMVDDLINAGNMGQHLDVRVYMRAGLRFGSEELYSRRYQRGDRKDGSHVLVSYDVVPTPIRNAGRGRAAPAAAAADAAEKSEWVGVVQKFVSIAFKGRADLRPMRLALVNFYQFKAPIGDADTGTIYRVNLVPAEAWHDKEYPVLLDSIDGKLAYTSRTVIEADKPVKERLLCKYVMYSGAFNEAL
jgi:hypothetical protein